MCITRYYPKKKRKKYIVFANLTQIKILNSLLLENNILLYL